MSTSRPERTLLDKRRRESWLRADEAAEHLRLSLAAIYRAVRRGEIPAHRLGRRRLRFRVGELDALLHAKDARQ